MNRGSVFNPVSRLVVNILYLHIVVKNPLTPKAYNQIMRGMDVNPYKATKWLHRFAFLHGMLGSVASLGSCVHQVQSEFGAAAPKLTD